MFSRSRVPPLSSSERNLSCFSRPTHFGHFHLCDFVGILWGWPLLVPDRSTWSQITPEQVTVSVNSPWSRAPRSTFCLFPPPSYRNASSSARRNSSGWAPGPPCCRTRKQLPSGARWSVGNTTEETTPRGLLRKNMTAV